jgi:hypothetical protein
MTKAERKSYSRLNLPVFDVWRGNGKRTQVIPIVVLIMLLSYISPVFAYTNEQIANAIYRAENSVKYPYGIKSIDTHGDKAYARKICLNTIRNNRGRFLKQTKYQDFIEFLGSRYCPPSAHSLNKNWVKNVRYWLCSAN